MVLNYFWLLRKIAAGTIMEMLGIQKQGTSVTLGRPPGEEGVIWMIRSDILLWKKLGLLGEMANSRVGAREIQDEFGASCSTSK